MVSHSGNRCVITPEYTLGGPAPSRYSPRKSLGDGPCPRPKRGNAAAEEPIQVRHQFDAEFWVGGGHSRKGVESPGADELLVIVYPRPKGRDDVLLLIGSPLEQWDCADTLESDLPVRAVNVVNEYLLAGIDPVRFFVGELFQGVARALADQPIRVAGQAREFGDGLLVVSGKREGAVGLGDRAAVAAD